MSEFIHLHNHTHFSLLDAACTPEQLVKAALDDGHSALALTDHGVMFGALEFYNKAKKAGIKPIIGFEAYVANGSRFDRSAGKTKTKKKNYYHLILIAKNKVGYHNLMKLTTFAHAEGFYYKPRIDLELLEKYHEGLIASSACIAGVINAHLVDGDYQKALDTAQYYKDLFGEDFYIELQDHNLAEDEIILRDAPKIAKELGIKLVATNDVHYIKKEHAIPHNVYLLIKDVSANSELVDVKKLRYKTPEMYFKSTEEMVKLFKDYPEAISSTIEIADKCELDFKQQYIMPNFDIPKSSPSENLAEYLVEKTYEGLHKRFQEITPVIKERTDFELNVINKMGYAGYFLIVQDFILAAKEMGVRVGPGRGSAAGSLVAYALEITNVDPLPYDLLFERFLNPDRVSMPDIDIDFADDKREMVIDYVRKKYGENSVAQIITFGTLSSRAVLKDVGRVLGIPHTEINSITSKIPSVLGKVTPLIEAFKLPELKHIKDGNNEQIKQLIEYSTILEGFYRNTSTHAAGVVITPGDVSDFVPLYSNPSQKTHGADFATQYTMKVLEEAGLLKMDFLGLRTLSIIENTLEMIKTNYGKDIDVDTLPLDDEQTYEIFANGSTLAIFQFESNGMKDYLRQLKPKSIEEITAMNALYRPGPMASIPDYIDRKFKRKQIEYLHPMMESSLNKTFGIIVYQEQVMQLARDLGGFTLGQADNLRRAMGKKNQQIMNQMRPLFIAGAEKNNISSKIADEVFELLFKFADYGFNKSHSLAYSVLAYQTAWLKAHYPAEFLASNMSAELNDLDKIVQLIEDAKRFDINVLPPDVNRSIAKFKAEENTIFFGMAAIKNVGTLAVESIIKAREEKPFKSFFDFVGRVDTRLINKRALEALICAGAFDSLNSGHRAALYAAIEPALNFARAVQGTSDEESLFGEETIAQTIQEPKLPDISEWTERERLDKEKEVLNFYISGHPLYHYQAYVESLATLNLGDKETNLVGAQVRVCGLITDIRTRLDKKNNTIAFVMLEDFTGRAELIFWSKSYEKFRNLLTPDTAIFCIGKAESDGENLKIVAENVLPIEEAGLKYAKGISIWVDLEKTDLKSMDKLRILANDMYARNDLIFNVFNKSEKYQAMYNAENLNISLTGDNIVKICEIFGRKNVRLIV